MRYTGSIRDGWQDSGLECVAWAQIHAQGSFAVYGSEGVTSVTRTGAGDYTITWAVPFRSASSYAAFLCSDSTAGSAVTTHSPCWQSTLAASARTQFLDYNAQSASDPDMVYVAAIGDF